MNNLGTVIAVLLLFFLFWGEPDVWDRWHAQAMNINFECVK